MHNEMNSYSLMLKHTDTNLYIVYIYYIYNKFYIYYVYIYLYIISRIISSPEITPITIPIVSFNTDIEF